jgi:LPS-assembly lipoprotein
MSWSEASSGLGAALAGLALLALAGCGFEPLYAEKDNGGGPMREMSRIKVLTISERTGQILRNNILERINIRGQPTQPAYLLDVRLHTRTQGAAVRRDESYSRRNYYASARYYLLSPDGKTIYNRGEVRSFTSFNIFQSRYATNAAQDDAQERAMRDLAEKIRTSLALYFQGLGPRTVEAHRQKRDKE